MKCPHIIYVPRHDFKRGKIKAAEEKFWVFVYKLYYELGMANFAALLSRQNFKWYLNNWSHISKFWRVDDDDWDILSHNSAELLQQFLTTLRGIVSLIGMSQGQNFLMHFAGVLYI